MIYETSLSTFEDKENTGKEVHVLAPFTFFVVIGLTHCSKGDTTFVKFTLSHSLLGSIIVLFCFSIIQSLRLIKVANFYILID